MKNSFKAISGFYNGAKMLLKYMGYITVIIGAIGFLLEGLEKLHPELKEQKEVDNNKDSE